MRGATHHAGRRCDCGAIISIHAPHARSDRTMHIGGSDRSQFQSTLLMRGATRLPSTARASAQNFNPRSSCEERLDIIRQRESQGTISIHAPHARSDPGFAGGRRQLYNFNPRSSCEERRGREWYPHGVRDFNPRSSCEERLTLMNTMTHK